MMPDRTLSENHPKVVKLNYLFQLEASNSGDFIAALEICEKGRSLDTNQESIALIDSCNGMEAIVGNY